MPLARHWFCVLVNAVGGNENAKHTTRASHSSKSSLSGASKTADNGRRPAPHINLRLLARLPAKIESNQSWNC